jgi:hypothetical protein
MGPRRYLAAAVTVLAVLGGSLSAAGAASPSRRAATPAQPWRDAAQPAVQRAGGSQQ